VKLIAFVGLTALLAAPAGAATRLKELVSLEGVRDNQLIGYGLVVGLFGLFGVELGPLVWILGVAAGVIFAVATLMLNLQKYVVIFGSAMLGAAAIVGTILSLLNQIDPVTMADHPVKVVTDAGFGWSLLFLGVAVIGVLFQMATTRYYEIERYNRWEEYNTAGAAS